MDLMNVTNSLTMSSLEIAKLTSKDHRHVTRDIDNMFQQLSVDTSQFGCIYKDKVGRKQRAFNLPKRETLILVSGYSTELRARIIDRWLELERLKQSRAASHLEAPALTHALKSVREAVGKETKPYHYSNEFNMINNIALGATSKQMKEHLNLSDEDALRDHLTPEQIKCIEHLQRLNTSLIEIGMSYDERKQKLADIYKAKYESKLLEEILRLEG